MTLQQEGSRVILSRLSAVGAGLIVITLAACRSESADSQNRPQLLANPAELPVIPTSWPASEDSTTCVPIESPLSSIAQLALDAPSGATPRLASVGDVVIDRSGNVFLLEPESARVHRFDSHGRYRATFGGESTRADSTNRRQMRATALTATDDRVYVLELQPPSVRVYSRDGSAIAHWQVGRLLPQGAEVTSIAVAAPHVYIGLLAGFPASTALPMALPTYAVLRIDTAGGSPALLDRLDSADFAQGSLSAVRGFSRQVGADSRYLVIGDEWHRDLRVLDHEGRGIWRFESCLSEEPNRVPAPLSSAGGGAIVGGKRVSSRISALGDGRFARLTPFLDRGAQHVEFIEVMPRSAWVIAVPAPSNAPRRFTGGALADRVGVFFNSFSRTAEWLEIVLPRSVAQPAPAGGTAGDPIAWRPQR